jgi:hypothetical protein
MEYRLFPYEYRGSVSETLEIPICDVGVSCYIDPADPIFIQIIVGTKNWEAAKQKGTFVKVLIVNPRLAGLPATGSYLGKVSVGGVPLILFWKTESDSPARQERPASGASPRPEKGAGAAPVASSGLSAPNVHGRAGYRRQGEPSAKTNGSSQGAEQFHELRTIALDDIFEKPAR